MDSGARLALGSDFPVEQVNPMLGFYAAVTRQDAEGRPYFGQAFAIQQETTRGRRVLIFSAESRDGYANTRSRVYNHMKETVLLYDAVSLRQQDDRRWRYDYLSRSIPYPVPRSWTTSTSTDNLWRLYHPDDNSQSFVALAELTGDSRESVLARLIDGFIPDADITLRDYSSEFYGWKTAAYTREADGSVLVGRVYVTRIGNLFYSVRFETIDNEQAADLFREVFEPIVDGFAPPSNVLYASGDLQPAFIKAALLIANDTCNAMPRDTVCFGNGIILGF